MRIFGLEQGIIDFCNLKECSENLDLNAREWCCLHHSTLTVDLRQAKAQVVFTNFNFLFILDGPLHVFQSAFFFFFLPQSTPRSNDQSLSKLFFFSLSLSFRLRKACHWLVNLRHFDNTILVIILISSVLLALEDPVDENSQRNTVKLWQSQPCLRIILGQKREQGRYYVFID